MHLQCWFCWATVSLKFFFLEFKFALIFFIYRCECNLQEYSSSKELDNQCREPRTINNETQLAAPCSERGECLCGQCFCNSDYEGKYCECDSCPM